MITLFRVSFVRYQLIIVLVFYPVQSADNRRLTALHIAAKYNRVEIAEILLDNGVEISPVDETKHSPLHIAAQDGFTEMVRLLLRRCESDEERSEVNLS